VESYSIGEDDAPFIEPICIDAPDKQIGFWDAYLVFRQSLDQQALDIELDEIFANVRDQTPPREVEW
jgi:hypothetical protein